MKIKTLCLATAAAVSLVACSEGEINVDAKSVDNSIDNSVTDSNNTGGGVTDPVDPIVCATNGDVTGVVEGKNCVYSEQFVNFDKPLTQSLTLRDIGEGAHIFQGSLFVGQNYETLAEANAAGLEKGGDGPILTIQPGVTVALQDSDDFIAIMRGSQIVARGAKDAPITFTSEADVNGQVTPEQTQTWGGMIINGFGFTNACEYKAGWDPASTADDAPALELEDGKPCSIRQEGTEGARQNVYGGTVPDDNSGVLSYVVVKHAGNAIVEGDELNGINFGAVGSGTTLNNVEVYSNFDDGIEFFGGGADLQNYVAMYVRDDSIDIDQGYYGTITNALVIQGGAVDEATKTGAHCVESDGSAGSTKVSNIAKGYVSKAVIQNLTCIISAKGPGVAGNSDPGAGVNAEEGHNLTLENAIVTTAYAVDATLDNNGEAIEAGKLAFTNYCFQLEDPEDLVNAGNGLINIANSIFACADLSAAPKGKGDFTITPGSVFTEALSGQDFLKNQGNVLFQTAADGTTPPNAGSLLILDSFYSVPVAEMMVDGMTPAIMGEVIGAVSRDNDWTAGWTYGLHEDNRGQPLWFE